MLYFVILLHAFVVAAMKNRTIWNSLDDMFPSSLLSLSQSLDCNCVMIIVQFTRKVHVPTAFMGLSSVIFDLTALASAYLVIFAATSELLPWGGRGFGLAVNTLYSKYLTYVLIDRNGGTDSKLKDCASIKNDGRKSACKSDTGVMNIEVNANAIFKDGELSIMG